MPRRFWTLRLSFLCLLLLLWGCATGTEELETLVDVDASSVPDIDKAGVDATTEAATPPPPPEIVADAAADTHTAVPEAAPELAPQPVLTQITPAKALVGSPGPTVVLTGSGFVAASVVQVDGTPLATTFIDDTELRITLPSAKLAAVGLVHISVITLPPGGGLSADLTFAVDNPAPTLMSLAPTNAPKGASDTQLTVNGAAFVSGAKVTFAGVDLVTTFVSAQSLTAVIPGAKLAASGSFDIRVVNNAPGGGTSTPIAFTVTNPTVTVTSITPVGAGVGAAATPVALVGTGFIPASAVAFNGNTVSSTYVDATHLNATLPASALGTAGSFPIIVTNPAPGGGVSTPVIFLLQYPAPTASSLAPSSVIAGAAATPVTVTGTGFYATSQITFDNVPATTTYVDATHVRATLSASQLSVAKVISVRVVNAAPGGGTSAALAFTVNVGLPVITVLNPIGRPAGSPNTTLTITGSGFVAASVVQSNGGDLVTTYISPTQLTAVIPAAQLMQFATLAITVYNPPPGGGTSTLAGFSVGCDSTGVDVLLGAPGTTWNVTLAFASAPTATRIDASGACPTSFSTSTSPYRAVVVQNSTQAAVTASAWAVCTSGGHDDDAFMTFYRRPTPPVTDADRKACLGFVSEGALGATGTTAFTSPEAGGSKYCPGLTLANGGGLSLGSCEKAVVYIQAYSLSSTLYPPPATMRLRSE